MTSLLNHNIEALSDAQLSALSRLITRERRARLAAARERNAAVLAAVAAGATFDEAAAIFGVARSAIAGTVFRAGGVSALRARHCTSGRRAA